MFSLWLSLSVFHWGPWLLVDRSGVGVYQESVEWDFIVFNLKSIKHQSHKSAGT